MQLLHPLHSGVTNIVIHSTEPIALQIFPSRSDFTTLSSLIIITNVFYLYEEYPVHEYALYVPQILITLQQLVWSCR